MAEVEHRDLILRSTTDYRLGRADFADYLIAYRNLAAGCSQVRQNKTRPCATVSRITVLKSDFL